MHKIVLAIVVGLAVFLGCVLLADLLNALGVGAVGDFLGSYSGLIGVLAGIWYYFTRP